MIILCEGNEDGIDQILLEKILNDSCRVVAVGSRFGMKHRIEVLRMVCDEPAFAVLDRDFSETWLPCRGESIPWIVNNNSTESVLGWFWERKEIENYLLEPIVIQKTLGMATFDWSEYEAALESARDAVAVYQAARIALSLLGRTGQYYVPSSFGPEHGSGERYRFPLPDELGEEHCRQWLQQVDEEYKNAHLVRFRQLQHLFEQYKTQCSSGGVRYHDYLSAFSGKDLAWRLSSWFKDKGFQGTKHFFTCMQENLRKLSSGSLDWLSEWVKLKDMVRIKAEGNDY